MRVSNKQIDAWIPDPDIEPLPECVAVMSDIDSMPTEFRALVREFGYVIVRDMRAEGYNDADQLRSLLEVWRFRRQEQWLQTDYITPKNRASRLRGLRSEAWHEKQMVMRSFRKSA